MFFEKKTYSGRSNKDPNGIKTRKKDLTLGILTGVLYLILVLLTVHYCAQVTVYPTNDFFDNLFLAITEFSHYPFQFIAIPTGIAESLGMVSIFYLAAAYYIILEIKKNEHIDPRLIGGTAKFNDNLKIYNRKYSAPYGKTTHEGEINTILTDDVYLSMDTRKTRRNLNLLVIGGSGAGKSRYLVKPNLCQMPLNCNPVITDPSGELLADTGKMLEDFGFKIKVFNVVDMSKSCHYNPLNYIHTVNDVILLTDCILANTTDPNKKGGDDFWEKAQKLMFQAFISFLWQYGKELGLEPNMESVMDLTRESQITEEASSTADPNKVDVLFAAIEFGYTRGEKGQIIPGTPDAPFENARGKQEFCVKQYKAFKLGAGKTLKSILISAYARLSCFDSEDVLNLTRYDDLHLEELSEQKSALFIIIPQENDSFNFLVAMMYSQLFQSLYFKAENYCQGNYIIKDARGENVKVFEMLRDEKDFMDDYDENAEEEEVSLTSGKPKKKFNFLKILKKTKPNIEKRETKEVIDPETSDGMRKIEQIAKHNEKETIPDSNPGDEMDSAAETAAKEYVEKLKTCHLVKKGKKYIVKLSDKDGGEIVGIYGNKEYAIKRTEALRDSKITRCGLFLPYHVRMMLDEFANIGQIPNFTKLLATMRKYEISCTVILQSIAQIKNQYKDDWGTIIGNCDSMLFLGCPEQDTLEYISKKLGKTTIRTKSDSQSSGKKGSSHSYQYTSRDLMSPDELGSMEDDECILFIRGVHPFRGKKYTYENHPNYKYTKDGSDKNLYVYRPAKQKTDEKDTLEQTNDISMPNKIMDEKMNETIKNKIDNFSINIDGDSKINVNAPKERNESLSSSNHCISSSSRSTSSHRKAFNNEPTSLPKVSKKDPMNVSAIENGRRATPEDMILCFCESRFEDEDDNAATGGNVVSSAFDSSVSIAESSSFISINA